MNQYTTDEAPRWINDAWLTGCCRRERRWRCYLPLPLSLSLTLFPSVSLPLLLSLSHLPSFGSCSCVVSRWSISLCSVKEESDSNRITLGFVHFAFVPLDTVSDPVEGCSCAHGDRGGGCVRGNVDNDPKVSPNHDELHHKHTIIIFLLRSLRHLKVTPVCVPPVKQHRPLCDFFQMGIRITTLPSTVMECDD